MQNSLDNLNVNFIDFMGDRYNKIHKELYNEALHKFILGYMYKILPNDIKNDLKDDESIMNYCMKNYTFFESKNENLYEPSFITVSNKSYPFNTIVSSYSLKKYWNKQFVNYDKNVEEKYNDLLINPEFKTPNIVEDINTVSGNVTLLNKESMKHHKIKLSALPKVSKGKLLNDTFTYMFQNIY